MRRLKFVLLFVTAFFSFVACEGEQTTELTTEPNLTNCQYNFSETYGQVIPFESINIPTSKVLTNPNNFICGDTENHPLIIKDSNIKTHQIFIEFDAIYPVESLTIHNYMGDKANGLQEISIEVSIDGYRFQRVIEDYNLDRDENIIDLGDTMIKKIKLVFDDSGDTVGIDSIKASLGHGLIIKEETELSNRFLRDKGWTGADGIFTFDMNHGGDQIGLDHDDTGFIFSDTFIGEVNNEIRRRNFELVNNTFGYLDHVDDTLSFDWDQSQDLPKSVLIPDAYTGSRARNLLDGDGLSITHKPSGLLTHINEGTMWLSDDLNSELIIDLNQSYELGSMYLWNYNANPNLGVKAFSLYISNDGINYQELSSYDLDKASGHDLEAYTKEILFDQEQARFLKIVVTDTYDDTFVGLGKLMFFTKDMQLLFGNISATSEILTKTENEESSRLWLQDGLVLNGKLYVFPILVKDFSTFFKVHNVGLIEMDIVDKKFDFENASYMDTPLMVQTDDGGVIYFGAGVMDNRAVDGYIYVYGYKDLDGRHLVVARVSEDDFLNFNEWTYYDGDHWTKNINDVKTLKEGVSAELSVTYIETGIFENKYLLVSMENTTSGRIVYSLSDTPYGGFSEFIKIYETTENEVFNNVFSYNAKLHPNLSTREKLIISYNVNSSDLSAFSNAQIYYPRFISVTQVKNEEE